MNDTTRLHNARVLARITGVPAGTGEAFGPADPRQPQFVSPSSGVACSGEDSKGQSSPSPRPVSLGIRLVWRAPSRT